MKGPCPSSDPGTRYLLLVKTGVPSILVSQPLRRQSSPPVGRQKSIHNGLNDKESARKP